MENVEQIPSPQSPRRRQLTKSLRFIEACGLTVVPSKTKSKLPDPDRERDQKLSQMGLQEFFNTYPDLDPGFTYTPEYVDVDVDSHTDYISDALDVYLPPSHHIYGHRDKPRSHRIYRMDPPMARSVFGSVLNYTGSLIVDTVKYGVEILSEAKHNNYVKLPGAVHPDSGLYSWVTDPATSVSRATPVEVLNGIRKAMAAAILADHWQPGARHFPSMALGSILRRKRDAHEQTQPEEGEEVSVYTFAMDREEAIEWFKIFHGLVEDTDKGHITSFRNGWDADPDKPKLGIPHLIEATGSEAAVDAIQRLLFTSCDSEAIDAALNRYAITVDGKFIDLGSVPRGDGMWEPVSQTGFITSHRTEMITMRPGQPQVHVSSMLVNHKDVKKVTTARFDFDSTTTEELIPTNYNSRHGNDMWYQVNMFRGWGVTPHPKPVENEEMEPFIHYLYDLLGAGSYEAFHSITSWCAQMFQNPDQKPGVAMVLVNKNKGAGKSFLGEKILTPLLSPRGMPGYSWTCDSVEQITGEFNGEMGGQLLVQVEEAQLPEQKRSQEKLKNSITAERIRIHIKGSTPFMMKSRHRYLMTSNNEEDAVWIDLTGGERRFSIFKVSDKYAKTIDKELNQRYFNDLLVWLGYYERDKSKTILPKILRWLLDYEISENFVHTPMETMAARNMRRGAAGPELKWLMGCIEEENVLGNTQHSYWQAPTSTNLSDVSDSAILDTATWPRWVAVTELQKAYNEYAREHKLRTFGKSDMSSLGTALKQVWPELMIGEKRRLIRTVLTDKNTGQRSRKGITYREVPTIDVLIQRFQAIGIDLDAAVKTEDDGQLEKEEKY